MYGIFAYIYHRNQPNIGSYTIHGSYGWYILYLLVQHLARLNCLLDPPGRFNAMPNVRVVCLDLHWPLFRRFDLPFCQNMGQISVLGGYMYKSHIHTFFQDLPSCQRFVLNYKKCLIPGFLLVVFKAQLEGQRKLWKKTCLFRVFRRMKYYQSLPSHEGIIS